MLRSAQMTNKDGPHTHHFDVAHTPTHHTIRDPETFELVGMFC